MKNIQSEYKSRKMLKLLAKRARVDKQSMKKIKLEGLPVNKAHELFVRNLRFLMETKGLTPKTLAEKLGRDPSAISHWLSGRSAPALRDLPELANIFNVPMKAFLNDPDDGREVEAPPALEKAPHDEEVARFVLESLGFRAGKLARKKPKTQE